jgi:hypothetical protein
MSNTCGVDRDDSYMVEGHGVPFMMEDCYSKDSWSLPSYEGNCCNKYSNGKCRPTIQGGYCHGLQGNSRVYYKYTDDEYATDGSGRSINRISRNQVGKESPYSSKDEKYHKSGLNELGDLQKEFYNELMLNRIMKSEPTRVRRNLEKEELVLEELEEEELRKILQDLEKDEEDTTETVVIVLVILAAVLGISLFIYKEEIKKLFKKQGKSKGKSKGKSS